jgi:uncharacterized protein (TIGR02271 family)
VTEKRHDRESKSTDTVVLPITQEQVEIRRQEIETGVTRIAKKVTERSERIDEPLLRQHVEVNRVPVGRVVDEPMPPRYEGDVLIVPVVEEEVVVTRRWVLKEELHVIRRTVEERHRETIKLRSEDAVVEHQPRSERNG